MKDIPPHDNIVEFLGSEEETNMTWIFTRYCAEGDLESYYLQHSFTLDNKINIMAQTTRGILHLHQQDPPVVHRDIKPSNILITIENGKLVAKICDFGIARTFDDDLRQLDTNCGTKMYKAPEFYDFDRDGNVKYTISVDVFSAGLFFYTLFKAGDKRELLPPTSETLFVTKYSIFG